MAKTASVNCVGVRYFNGAWSAAGVWHKPKTTYAGAHPAPKPTTTCLKFTLPAFSGEFRYIEFYPTALRGLTGTTATTVTLLWAIRASESDSLYGGKYGPISDSGAIMTGEFTFTGLTDQYQRYTITTSKAGSLSSGGTYYLYLWAKSTSSSFVQFYDGGNVANFWLATMVYYEQFTVTFNANGGGGAPSNQIKIYGRTITLSTTKPTRTGYTFSHWNTKSDGSGTTYAPGEQYGEDSNVTLYAIWTINKYTITFNANGGTGAPSSQTKTHGTDLVLSTTKPTRSGYTFSHWNTKSDGSGTSYTSGGKWTANTSGTLFAIWTPNKYTVTYDANGGSGAPSSQTKTHGVNLTLSSTKPSRSGCTFVGWNTTKYNPNTGYSSSNVSYLAGDTYSSNSAITLYAVWKLHDYTIAFNKNDEGASGTINSVKIAYGSSYTLPGYTFTKTGYTHNGYVLHRNSDDKWHYGSTYGWLTVTQATNKGLSNNNRQVYPVNHTITNWSSVDDDVCTLYARWTVNTYTVTINPNGGKYNNSTSNSTVKVDYNGTTTISNPTRTNYTFKGWTISGSGKLSGTTLTVTGNVTLTAQWEIIKRTVTFDANGGTASYTSLTVNTGSAIGKLPTATRKYYNFLGWYNSSGTKITTSTVISSNVTFTAKWEEIKYKLTIKPNGGLYGGSTSDTVVSQRADSTYTLSTPTRTNYNFSYWATSGNGTLSGSTFTFGEGNMTLTAQWEIIKRTVTFDANGGTASFTSLQVNTGSAVGKLPIATREHYNFLGWYNSLGIKVTTSTVISSNVTFTAKWEDSELFNKYALIINPNGGIYDDSTNESIVEQPANTTFVLSNDPVRTNYNFTGWTLSGYGSLNDDIFTFGEGSAVLTAQWEIIKRTVTFMGNGGTPSFTSLVVNNGSPIGQLPTATLKNYKLIGWFDVMIKEMYTTNTIVTMDTTLVAQWELIKYNLTINPNGGLYNGSSDEIIVSQGENTSYTLNTPIRDDYIFKGWALTGVGTLDDFWWTYTFGNDDAVVTAIWERETRTITWDASHNGGKCAEVDGGEYVNTITKQYNINEAVGVIPNAYRAGYKFIGWFTNPNGSGTQYTSTTNVSQNITLYAIFEIDLSIWYKTDEGVWVCGQPYHNSGNTFHGGFAYLKTDTDWEQGIGE